MSYGYVSRDGSQSPHFVTHDGEANIVGSFGCRYVIYVAAILYFLSLMPGVNLQSNLLYGHVQFPMVLFYTYSLLLRVKKRGKYVKLCISKPVLMSPFHQGMYLLVSQACRDAELSLLALFFTMQPITSIPIGMFLCDIYCLSTIISLLIVSSYNFYWLLQGLHKSQDCP